MAHSSQPSHDASEEPDPADPPANAGSSDEAAEQGGTVDLSAKQARTREKNRRASFRFRQKHKACIYHLPVLQRSCTCSRRMADTPKSLLHLLLVGSLLRLRFVATTALEVLVKHVLE